MKKEELIKINFHAELAMKIHDQISFIREEFDYLFGQKTKYTDEDRKMAAGLINHLAKIVDSPIAIDKLSQMLEELENTYKGLF